MNTLKALVGISAIIGLVCLVIVTLITTIRPEHLSAAVWIVAPLCLMGGGMGYFATKVTVKEDALNP